jgi:hypothetical protein
LSAWFLFSGDLNTNVEFSDFILVKIYSKFDVRKQKFFNRFHSPVIVHRKHEGAVTRHEFLPSSARKHLQLQGAAAP